MTEIVLPPVPDTNTGKPRPPHAPLMAPKPGPDRSNTNSRRLHEPPSGQSPVLEWYRHPSKTGPIAGLVAAALVLVVFFIKDPSFAWVSTWWLWLFPLFAFLCFVLLGRGDGFSAGADWFARAGFGGKPGAFVRTYELTSVTVSLVALREEALDLTDSAGRTVHIRLSVVQLWPPAWDLLYNGILHSIQHNGATTDERVRELLQDGDHLELAEHAARQAERARDG